MSMNKSISERRLEKNSENPNLTFSPLLNPISIQMVAEEKAKHINNTITSSIHNGVNQISIHDRLYEMVSLSVLSLSP